MIIAIAPDDTILAIPCVIAEGKRIEGAVPTTDRGVSKRTTPRHPTPSTDGTVCYFESLYSAGE